MLLLSKKTFIKPKFSRFSRLSRKQRLLNKNKYLKRRLLRLTKRANWLKRKHKKRLKLIRKSRRISLYFTQNKQNIVAKTKKISLFLFKNPKQQYKTILKPIFLSKGHKLFNVRYYTKQFIVSTKLNIKKYSYI